MKKSFLVFFLSLLTITALAGCSSSPKKDATLESYRNLCKTEMNYAIKAPSTAKYSEPEAMIYPNPYTTVEWEGVKITSLLEGYVDSQNSYGAQTRTYFTCYMSDNKAIIKIYGDGNLPFKRYNEKVMQDLKDLSNGK